MTQEVRGSEVLARLAGVPIEDCLRTLTQLLAELVARGPTELSADCLLTAEELGERLRLPARTIRDQAAAGLIPHHRIGKHYRFSADDIAEFLKQTKQHPVTARGRRAARVA